ncbi:MAG TPA: biopolymer transporter ExbD [Elusimicrobia bacterium]|nr:biopolymer transporter ExbD [Elusimicrobiota bacterium]
MPVNDLPDESIISEINMTPLVDVSLVLVIIFMLIAPFLTRLLKPMQLPPSKQASLNDQNTVKISIFKDGTLAVNTDVVDESALGERILKEITKGKSPWALVRADTEIPYEKVTVILQLIKKAGIERVAFATRPVEAGAK